MRHSLRPLVALALLLGPLAGASGAADGAYTLGAASEIDYYVVHPMHHIKAVTHALEGKLVFADDHLVTPLTLKLPLVSFNSGNVNRDNNAAFYLDITHFPTATLEVTHFTETAHSKMPPASTLPAPPPDVWGSTD